MAATKEMDIGEEVRRWVKIESFLTPIEDKKKHGAEEERHTEWLLFADGFAIRVAARPGTDAKQLVRRVRSKLAMIAQDNDDWQAVDVVKSSADVIPGKIVSMARTRAPAGLSIYHFHVYSPPAKTAAETRVANELRDWIQALPDTGKPLWTSRHLHRDIVMQSSDNGDTKSQGSTTPSIASKKEWIGLHGRIKGVVEKKYSDAFVANYMSLETSSGGAKSLLLIVTWSVALATILPTADWVMLVGDTNPVAGMPFDTFQTLLGSRLVKLSMKVTEKDREPTIMTYWRVEAQAVSATELAAWAKQHPPGLPPAATKPRST